jgi:hypothetical protein
VLLWFMLSLGAAIVAPFVHPQVVELVCTSLGAVKAVVHTDSGVEEQGMGHLDCPLCLLAGPPPSLPVLDLPAILPLGHAVQAFPSARIAVATAGPLPARGPPTLS